MSPSDLGTMFGTFAAIGALLLVVMQLLGARMTRYVAGVAFLFTLAVGIWAIVTGPVPLTLGTVWKFGLLYGMMFLALLLERAARKEEAEQKILDVQATHDKAVEEAKSAGFASGVEAGELVAWADRKKVLELTRKTEAYTGAVAKFCALAGNSAEAQAIYTAMSQQIADADHAALLDIAREVEASGILIKRQVSEDIRRLAANAAIVPVSQEEKAKQPPTRLKQ